MKIYLIRHGETLENVGTLLMGRTDGILSEIGKQEAMKTGERLKDENAVIIYSSPLLRCLDTAQLINKSLNLPLEKHDLLMERDFGKYTNISTSNFDFNLIDHDTEENQKDGVESMKSVKERAQKFLSEVFEKHPDEEIIVVTHNNIVRFLLGEFLKKTYQEVLSEYKVHNCSINIFSTKDGKSYEQILLDDTSHLK